MVDVSIGIVSNSNKALLAECLESIRTQTRSVSYEVIVVDNNSTDGSLAMLREQFPWVGLIESHVSRGYTVNMNMALRLATGRYAVMLNDDTTLASDAFGAMIAFLDAHADYGAASPRIVNPDGTLQVGPRAGATFKAFACSELKLDRLFPRSAWLSGLDNWHQDPAQPCENQTMSGACIVVRATVLAEVGLLEERIAVGPDDVEFSHRVRAAGWRLHYAGDVAVRHWGGTSRMRPQSIVRNQVRMYTGWYFLLWKHFGWSRVNALRPFVIAGALIRMGYWSGVFVTNSSSRVRAGGEIRGRLAVIALSASPRLRAHVTSLS